ncbi:THAP domain-containing protein 1 B-like, partial [Aphis craccivora]
IEDDLDVRYSGIAEAVVIIDIKEWIDVLKKLIWNSSRFGDLSLRGFETPNRAARNFKVIKTIVSQLRRKNKNLRQKCKRLQKKVETLNDLLEILKKKSLMTDFAADNLKVPIIILILIVY